MNRNYGKIENDSRLEQVIKCLDAKQRVIIWKLDNYNDKNISINSVINDTLWKNFNDEIYINGRYLLDSLNNIGTDEIALSYSNSITPLFLTNGNDIEIIMPIKK